MRHGIVIGELVDEANESADSTGLVLFTFDGRKYAVHECYRELTGNSGSGQKSVKTIPCK